MRIAIDARTLSWTWTGPWRYLRDLIDHLGKTDHENEYFLFLNGNQAESLILQPNFKKTLISSFVGYSLLTRLNTDLFSTVAESYLKAQALDPMTSNLLLPAFLRRDGIDVFHSPFHVLPFVKVCPSVVTIHDLAFEIFPNEFSIRAREFEKIFTRFAARKADVIIVPSACVSENLVQLYDVPQSKIRVIHEAANEIFKLMDKQEAKGKIKQKYGVKEDFLLFIGFARPRRNLPSLLKAFLKLKKQYSLKHKLVIVGRYDSQSTAYPQLIEELGLENDVIHFGHVPDVDMPFLYNAAEVFVYPSSYEGFGLPLVEAMSCGTPIVASKTAPMPEVVGKAGLFVDPFDVNEMTEKIHGALTDKHLQSELREKSLERSRSFSWEKTANRTVEAYREAKDIRSGN